MKVINVFLILAIIFLVSGVEQCPSGGSFGTTTSKSGLEITTVSGVGYFNPGMKLNQGDTFRVMLDIQNYDKFEKKGTICIKDNQDDAYGGISVSGDCASFAVPEASFSGDKMIQSSSQKIAFPINGEYSYRDVPIQTPAKLFITYSYIQQSSAQGIVNVPLPDQETISLNEIQGPVSVSVDKTISKQESQYKANLGVTFTKKSDSNTQLYTEDMANEKAIKVMLTLAQTASSSGYSMECTEINGQQGILGLESTKYIKCSSLLPLETTSYPFLVRMIYGVKTTNTFDFTIAKEEK